jgi:hypothetical protein
VKMEDKPAPKPMDRRLTSKHRQATAPSMDPLAWDTQILTFGFPLRMPISGNAVPHIGRDHRLARTPSRVLRKLAEMMIAVRSRLFASWTNTEFDLGFTKLHAKRYKQQRLPLDIIGRWASKSFARLCWLPPTISCSVVGGLYRRCLEEAAFSNIQSSSAYVQYTVHLLG